MTILFQNKAKEKVIELLRQNAITFIYPGLTDDAFAQIERHLEMLRQDSREINVQCRFETFPEFDVTNITISVSLVARAEVKQ